MDVEQIILIEIQEHGGDDLASKDYLVVMAEVSYVYHHVSNTVAGSEDLN